MPFVKYVIQIKRPRSVKYLGVRGDRYKIVNEPSEALVFDIKDFAFREGMTLKLLANEQWEVKELVCEVK